MSGTNHYDILGVGRDASQEEVESAYRQIIRKVHPDQGGGALQSLASQVNRAHATLRDPAKRAEYDRMLDEDAASAAAPAFTPEDFGWGAASRYGHEEPGGGPGSGRGSDAPPGSGGSETMPGREQPDAEPERNEPSSDDSEQSDWGAGGRDPHPSLDDFDLGIDVLAMTPGGPIQPERIVPESRPVWLPWALMGLSWLCAIVLVAMLVQVTDSLLLRFFPVLLSAIPLVYVLVVKESALEAMKILYWVGAGLGALFLVGGALVVNQGAVNGDIGYGLVVLVIVLLVALVVPQFVGARLARAERGAGSLAQQMVSMSQARARVAGRVGDLIDARDIFGDTNLAKGIVGEKLTGQLLRRLAEVPGVRVFHGLRFPGTANADVDHLVLCGNHMVLLDSKLWRQGRYGWNLDGDVTARIRGRAAVREMHFPEAVRRYRQLFPDFQIEAFVLVHTAGDAGQLAFDNTYATDAELGGAREVMAETFRFLTTDHTGEVDRRVLARVYAQLKA